MAEEPVASTDDARRATPAGDERPAPTAPPQDGHALPTQQLAAFALPFVKVMALVAGLWLLGRAVDEMQGILTPIFLAFTISYVLDPLVDRLEARKIPRSIAIAIVMLGFVLAMAGFLLFVIPSLVEDIVRVAKDVPRRIAGVVVAFEPWLRERGLEVPHSVEEAMTRFGSQLQEAAPSALGGATQVLQTAGRGTLSFISGVGNLVVVGVFTFYLLLDFDVITRNARGLVPHRYRADVRDVVREIDATLAQWIRGQLTVMLILAILYSVGFSIAGIRLAVGIGILAGVLSFIPYLGTGVGLVLAVLMALIDWHGPLPLILVVAVVAAVQVLDGLFITPRIVGGKVGLGPAWIIIALMTGGQLFGFLGVLLAVPSAAVIKILVKRTVAYYRRTGVYRRDAAPGALEAEDEDGAEAQAAPPEAADDGAPKPPDDGGVSPGEPKPYSPLAAKLEEAARAPSSEATAADATRTDRSEATKEGATTEEDATTKESD
ncbi:MAG: AI-2E family transporter [Deltaproteobacteria bacterium]|nr:AI-2E family transporter [Deltaproteobacteria bacterium]